MHLANASHISAVLTNDVNLKANGQEHLCSTFSVVEVLSKTCCFLIFINIIIMYTVAYKKILVMK